jgi:hypothetical protein
MKALVFMNKYRYFHEFDKDILNNARYPAITKNEVFAVKREIGYAPRIEVYVGSWDNCVCHLYDARYLINVMRAFSVV